MKTQLLRYEAEMFRPAWLIAMLAQFVPPLLQFDPGLTILVYALTALGLTTWVCRWPWLPSPGTQVGSQEATLRDYWDVKCKGLGLALLTVALIPAIYGFFFEDHVDWLLFGLSLVTVLLAASTILPLLVLLLKNAWMASAIGGAGYFLSVVVLGRMLASLLQHAWLPSDPGELSFLAVILASWILSIACYLIGFRASARKELWIAKARAMNRIAKECRSLRSPWTIGVALMFVAALGREPGYLLPAGFVTCIIVAAAVFGNELNQQTLGVLLSQPISRRQLWYEKMLALSIALLTAVSAAAVLLTVFHSDSYYQDDLVDYMAIYGVAIFAIFTTVPMLTLLVRNSLAAMAFTPIIHFLLAMMVIGFGNWLCGEAYADYEDVVKQLGLFAIIGASAVFYLIGCRLFQRFECRESISVDLQLPRLRVWLPWFGTSRRRGDPPGRSYALNQMLWKELHLHRINLLLVGILCLGCLTMVGVHFLKVRAESIGDVQTFEFATEAFYLLPFFIYWLLAPLLIGAVGIAEERQLGVLEWHLVLPPSRWHQWLSKLLTAYGMLFVLAMILPVVLLGRVYLPLGMMGDSKDILTDYRWICLALFLATSVSIYAASISANTMKALINCLGLLIFGIVVSVSLSNRLDNGYIAIFLQSNRGAYGFVEGSRLLFNTFTVYLALCGLLSILFLGMLELSYENFKCTERSWCHTFLVPATLAVIIGASFSVWFMVYREVRSLGLI